MTFARLFRSPFVRVPFIGFAVVATVATSAPQWDLEARAVDEGVTLAPGDSFERKVEYDASHDVQLETSVTGPAASGTRIRVEHDDSNGDSAADAGDRIHVGSGACDARFTYESKEPGRWVFVRTDGTLDEIAYTAAESKSSCNSKSGVATVKVTNDGAESLKLHVVVRATIGGRDDEPDGAFVNAKVVQ